MKRQTRKIKHVNKLSPLMSTEHGLHNWHVEMFEKLGWMVLAKEEGLDYKIITYKKSLERLLASIEHVSSEYESADRKHDLRVLGLRVMCLKDFVEKHIPVRSV